MRVQNPMKWQPNEIDGLYMSADGKTIYPVEAKAVSTGDDINLEQMPGQYKTITVKMPGVNIEEKIVHIKAIKAWEALKCLEHWLLQLKSTTKLEYAKLSRDYGSCFYQPAENKVHFDIK